MEILIVVRLCCNCTYGEVGGCGCEFGCRSGSDAAGALARGWLSLLGVGGYVVLCSLKLGASLFQALLNHLGSGTWGHAFAFPAGQGVVLVAGQQWAGVGKGTPLCLGCAAGKAMGRGPRLLARGCECGGAGTSVCQQHRVSLPAAACPCAAVHGAAVLG